MINYAEPVIAKPLANREVLSPLGIAWRSA